MDKRADKKISDLRGDASIAPPFPLPKGEFDFGAPTALPPRPLAAERKNGTLAPLAHFSRTTEKAVPAVLVALMRGNSPEEFRYEIVDHTGGLAIFDGTDYAVSDAVSGEYAHLVLSALDGEAERRKKNGAAHRPNILLAVVGASAERIDELITAERISVYSRVGIYVLVAPSEGELSAEHSVIDESEFVEYSADVLSKTVAALDRRNI